MALQDIATLIPWPEPLGGAMSSANFATAPALVMGITQAHKTGSLTKVLVRLAIAGGGDVKVRLETVTTSVDATQSVPTGVLIATGAEAVIPAAAANVTYEVTLNTPANVTVGDTFAVVVGHSTFVATSAIARVAVTQSSWNFPHSGANSTGSTWTKTASFHLHSVMIDGIWAYQPGVIPAVSFSATSAGSNSVPDERGVKFTLPFAARVCGFWETFSNTNASVITLYDSSNTVLATVPMFAYGVSASANQPHFARFPNSVDLAAGFVGRITVKASSSLTIPVRGLDLASASHMAALSGGTNIVRTTRTDAGAWTDDPLGREFIGLLISHLGNDVGTVSNRKVKVGGAFVAA